MNFFSITKIQIFFAAVVVIFAGKFSLLLGGISFLLFFMILWFLRKKKFENRAEKYVTDDIFLSPITGIVKDIESNEYQSKILVKTSFYHQWGVYFPATCKITNFGFKRLKHDGISIFSRKEIKDLENNSYDFIEMENDSIRIELRFLNANNFEELSIGVDLGDIGSIGSNIGFKAFGGYLLISIYGKHRLNIKEGMKVSAIETFLCQSYE